MLKIAISVALIYFVLTKVDLGQVWTVLRTSRPGYLLLALLLFVMSKIASAYRLNLYFHRLGVTLTQKSNLKLYVLGMFYNLFLPGGIGGDAYKAYRIRKDFDVRTKKLVSALILDRLSGLLLLFVYACLLAMVLFGTNHGVTTIGLDGGTMRYGELHPDVYRILLATGILLGVAIFWGLSRYFLKETHPIFWKSIGHSSVVQGLQLVCLYGILCALSIQNPVIPYLLVFLVSSIVSVVPLTIGGIGSRELTFYYGALWLGLDQDTAVGISVAFFLITALVSLTGVYFHFKKPGLKLEPGLMLEPRP